MRRHGTAAARTAWSWRWLISTLVLLAAPVQAWDNRMLSAPVQLAGLSIPYPEFAVYLPPGSRFRLDLGPEHEQATVRYRDRVYRSRSLELEVPEQPGVSVLELDWQRAAASPPDSVSRGVFRVFSLTPLSALDEAGQLEGFQVGAYPQPARDSLPQYQPPAGLIRLTPENKHLRVSPNFRLDHFLCKQQGGFPKYLTLRPELVLKLEAVLSALNRSGRKVPGLTIMSGYRTPFYNEAIGNVAFSRHLWGGAADIYIDHAPADGVMDDLNGDGRADREDAVWLAAFIERTLAAPGDSYQGGLGVYGSNGVHGPFVHLDVRGHRARW